MNSLDCLDCNVQSHIQSESLIHESDIMEESRSKMPIRVGFRASDFDSGDIPKRETKDTTRATMRQKRVFEFHESLPVYARTSLSESVSSMFAKNPDLKNLKVFTPTNCSVLDDDSEEPYDDDINTDDSWFALLWTLVKQQPFFPDSE